MQRDSSNNSQRGYSLAIANAHDGTLLRRVELTSFDENTRRGRFRLLPAHQQSQPVPPSLIYSISRLKPTDCHDTLENSLHAPVTPSDTPLEGVVQVSPSYAVAVGPQKPLIQYQNTQQSLDSLQIAPKSTQGAVASARACAVIQCGHGAEAWSYWQQYIDERPDAYAEAFPNENFEKSVGSKNYMQLDSTEDTASTLSRHLSFSSAHTQSNSIRTSDHRLRTDSWSPCSSTEPISRTDSCSSAISTASSGFTSKIDTNKQASSHGRRANCAYNGALNISNKAHTKMHSRYRGVGIVSSTAARLRGNNNSAHQWRARMSFGEHRVHIGCYPTEEMAARAYDAALVKYKGAAPVNFPDEEPDFSLLSESSVSSARAAKIAMGQLENTEQTSAHRGRQGNARRSRAASTASRSSQNSVRNTRKNQ